MNAKVRRASARILGKTGTAPSTPDPWDITACKDAEQYRTGYTTPAEDDCRRSGGPPPRITATIMQAKADSEITLFKNDP